MTSSTKKMATRGVVLALLAGTTILGLAAPAATAPSPGSGAGGAGPCARADRLQVRGAEKQMFACLDDLTTAGTVVSGHTNQADWQRLHAPGATNPSNVPSVQVDGYFPDTSTTNTNNGWRHDAQFVIRLPEEWNGDIVITGTPGVRGQYANDFIISDWVLSKGYAFAVTDKGNTGASFYRDIRAGRVDPRVAPPSDRVDPRHRARRAIGVRRQGRPDVHGGHLQRRLPDPVAAGEQPPALRRRARLGRHPVPSGADLPRGAGPGEGRSPRRRRAVLHQRDAVLHADYDYDARPAPVEEAVRSISLTGNIKRPMITVHGDLDTLLPPAVDSDVYDQLIDEAGRSRLHRYYLVEDGTHVDGLYAAYPDRLRPLLPAPGTPSTCSWPGSSRDRLHRPTTSSHGRTTATS
jgi:hypothetical protein